MNMAPSHRISLDSRSADVARVCLTLAKTDSKAPWQCCNHGKDIAADLNHHPLTVLSSNKAPARPDCAMIQSP
jgi:hypothetical protein